MMLLEGILILELEVSEVLNSDLVEFHPSVGDVLALPLDVGPLAFVLSLEQHRSFSSLGSIWIPADLDVIVDVISFEEVLNILGFDVERQTSDLDSQVSREVN